MLKMLYQDSDRVSFYCRYARNIPNQGFALLPFNMQSIHHPLGHYDTGFAQLGQIPRPPGSLNNMTPPSAAMSPFCATGLSQGNRDAAYMHWPTASMMYAHSYEQFRHGVFQVSIPKYVLK